MSKFELILAAILKDAEVIVPLFDHSAKGNSLVGLIFGSAEAILATVAQVQASKAQAANAAPAA